MKKRLTLQFLFILASIFALTSADFEDLVTNVYSISTSPNAVSEYLQYASLEGGPYLYIKGAGFSTRSPLNKRVTIDETDCPIVEFLTTSTQVVCVIPPSDVEKKAKVRVYVDEDRIGTCYSCYLTYSYDATPLLMYMLPNAGSPGEEVKYFGVQRVSSSLYIDYVKIGEHRCDASEQNEYNPLDFDYGRLEQGPCNVPNMEAGYYNVSQKNMRNTGFARKLNTVPVYRFDGDAYDFAVVPRIDSISNNIGSSEGQIITVKGAGFSSSEQNEVRLADTECKILKQSTEEIECELQPRSTPIPDQGYHAGLIYEKTKNGVTTKATRLAAETPKGSDDSFTAKLKGYFKAPVTGDYKFFMSADDRGSFWFSDVPVVKTNLRKIVEIKNSNYYKFFFEYPQYSQVSESISLIAGEYYYMEIYMEEAFDEDFATVGVLIPNVPNTVNNPPKTQALKINCPINPEVLEFTLSNVEGGKWQVRFDYLSSDGKRIDHSYMTEQMDYNADPITVRNQLASHFEVSTNVVRKMLKSDGTETTNGAEARIVIFTVTFLTLRNNGRLPIIESSALLGSQASVTVTPLTTPTDPLRGTFMMSRGDQSFEFKYDVSIGTFADALRKLGFKDPIRGTQHGDPNMGLQWRFQFSGDSQAQLESLTFNSMLTGCRDPSEITFDIITIQNSSQQDLFYETIPFHLLHTAEDKPQITIKSNGVLGNCPGFNCDYTIQSTGLPTVTSSSYSAPALSISLTTVNTGDYTKEDLRVFLGNTECSVSTYNDASSPVTLTANCPAPEAGDHHPRVHFDGLGFAKVNPSVTKLTINAVISGVTPTQVNPNGGTVLTISGSGYPVSLEVAEERGLEVKIGSAGCTLVSVTPTQIRCISTPVGSSASLTVSLNAKTATSSVLAVLATPPTISSISPTSVSPVLQTDITITGSNFDSNIANTKILLSNSSNPQVTECLIISSTPTQIKCKLLGAATGVYNLYAKTSLGLSNSKTLEVKTIVTSVSPSMGSNAGGTILTIQGGAFSSDRQQTLVFIGEENVMCDVISSSPSQVQCKTRAKDISYGSTPQNVVVATRIVEESLCEGSCTFTYSDSMTAVVSMVTGTVVVPGETFQVFGAGFESTPPGTPPIVTVNNQACTVTSSDDSQITILVPADVAPNNVSTIAINVPGKGYASFNPDTNKIQIIPAFRSISPSTGSTAGVFLTLEGAGFQSGIKVQVGNTPCEIRSITPTSLVCKATSSGIVNVTYKEFTDQRCAGICSVTLSSAQTPKVNSISPLSPAASSFTLTILGTSLDLDSPVVTLISQTDKTASFTGSVSSATSNQITVSFSNVPAGTYAVEVACGPSLASGVFAVNVPLSVNVAAPVMSSIAGGSVITITGSGFFDNTQKEKNKVTVCGLPCEVIQSSDSSIQCQAPLFVNAAVKSSYANIVSSSKLTPAAAWSDAGQHQNVFDLAFTTTYKSYQPDCKIGIDVGEDLVAELSQIKFFPNPAILSITLKGTVIEGSNDNLGYTTIATIDANVHDGWNTISFTDQSSPIRYRYYRLRGATSAGKCDLAELQFYGIALSDTTTTNLNAIDCRAKVTVNDKAHQITDTAVSYRQSLTPVLTSISPKMGTAAGGTTLTLTGTGFIADVAQIKVYIDDIECSVQTASTTQITCVTGPAPSIDYRRSSLNSELKILFQNQGNAIVNNIKYFYIDKWSDINTWGGITPPREGESVSIPPGQTVLLDISPPKLKAIIIEGTLIFDDTNIDLHCEYILVRNGRLQIGTWDEPIQNKITVTLYGSKKHPQLPKFGNKVIGVMEGIMDIHGKKRTPTWTVLETTAVQGATSIVVKGVVDWVAGEQIVIASTDFDHYESESRKIASVTVNSPSLGLSTITFVDPLKFRHYGGIQTIDGQTFEMRAEVALLTRNVLIKGDDDSPKTKYGVHILTHSTIGDDSAIARISYTEVTQSGQAYNMGRYSIHYHLAGNVRESYVIGNSIHHTYNRAVTVHGVHYLKLQKNVAYWCMGHTIFIEDGIETHNLFEDNLVLNTMASTALLNTDQTPASFWITNPNNIWRRNHAAGSDRYGFWFDLREHPEGPSATTSICPTGERLGEFTDNQAHSCGRYGLRIFHEHIPRTYPCQPYQDAVANPPIQAEYKNFLGWKNRRSAVIGERLGAVKFKNIKTADNLRCGIEVSDGNLSPPDTLLVEDAWIVGVTPENGGPISQYESSAVRGLITPKRDWFLARRVHFSNFYNDMPTIETCSHCEQGSSSDPGARTSFFEGLTFNNIKQKVRFNIPFKEILVDKDGTLTDNVDGGKGVVTFYYDHLNVPGCVRDEAIYNGLVCDETVTVRRIEFFGTSDFDMQNLNLLRLEDNPRMEFDGIRYRALMKSWATPFVTGYSYRVFWANRADFNTLRIEPSEVIRVDDKTITLVFNHSEFREMFEINQYTGGYKSISNDTALWDRFTGNVLSSGTWYHDVTNQLLYVAINGKDKQNLKVNAIKCRINCPLPAGSIPKENVIRLWSNATQWPNQQLPKDGDDVEIPGDWVLKLDVSTAKLATLHIKGDLIFDSSKDDLVLTATNIWVEGQLFIGTGENDRYTKNAKIILTGLRNTKGLIIGPVQDVSNKVLAVTGNVTIFGNQVNTVWVRLQAPAKNGTTSILVPADVDWKVGDDILIAPTRRAYDEHEVRTIKSINNGVITFVEPLVYHHHGATTPTKVTPFGTLDMRAEVGLLTRNIKIQGSVEDHWGGRVYVGEVYDPVTSKYLTGRIQFDGVEMINLAQPNTSLAGLTYDRVTYVDVSSTVKKCVMRDSLGYQLRIVASKGIHVEDSIFFKGFKYQITFEESNSDIKFKNNLVIYDEDRGVTADNGDFAFDFGASFMAAIANFTDSEISGNTFAGCYQNCFVIKGGDCRNQPEGPYYVHDNVAHSGELGWLIKNPNNVCNGISHFVAYKLEQGINTFFATQNIRASHLIVSDSYKGISLNTGGVFDVATTSLKNSYVAGVSVTDPDSFDDYFQECSDLAGILIPTHISIAKFIPPKKSILPWYRVKGHHIWEGEATMEN